MRADNSHHIVTAARRRATATRHRAIAALRRMDNAGQLISFDAVAREGHVSRSWSTTSPTCAPRSNDSVPAGVQDLLNDAFPTGNAHPTPRCGTDSKSRPKEIASWRSRTVNYARHLWSPSANSARPPSSASPATRRERNLSQSWNPADARVDDSSHDESVQVNASGSHRAEDKHRLRPPPGAGIPAVAAPGPESSS
jgi:hypothetical protein